MKYLIITLSVLLIGCATIFKGAHGEVRINSTPSGATIMINGINKGSTPASLNLKRDKNYNITFKKQGYEEVVVEVDKKFDAATTIIGNIFSWGILGIVIDVASGAAYSLTPADVNSNMGQLRDIGMLPNRQISSNEVHVFMLTQQQWEELKTK